MYTLFNQRDLLNRVADDQPTPPRLTLNPNQVATPTFGYTGGAMVVLNQCVVSQGDTGVRLVAVGNES